MPSLPPDPTSGQPVRADWGQRLLNYLRHLPISGGPGIRVQHTGGGITISATRKAGKGGSSVVPQLQIINGSEAGKFSITDGSVNSQSPTLGGVPIAGYPLADPVVPPPEFTVTANTYVWIKVVGVFGSPTTHTITIETDTAGSGLGDPPAGTAISATGFTSFYYIGEVLFTPGSPPTYSISNWHSGGNVAVLSWGLYNVWGRA